MVIYTVLRCQRSRGGDGSGVSLIANGLRPPLDQKPLTDEDGGFNFYYPFRLAVVLLCQGHTCIHVFIFQFWISKKYTFYSQIISNKKHFIKFFLQLHINCKVYIPDFYCKFLFGVLSNDTGLPPSTDINIWSSWNGPVKPNLADKKHLIRWSIKKYEDKVAVYLIFFHESHT